MERSLSKSAPLTLKIGTVLAQRLRQAGVEIMETTLIEVRGGVEAFRPLRLSDFIRNPGKLAQ